MDGGWAVIERSLEQMRRRAVAALAGNPVTELRNLQIEKLDDGLLIQGTVTSYYHKQLAQEAVRLICDGVRVVNLIRVD
jgi:hypothetical protein